MKVMAAILPLLVALLVLMQYQVRALESSQCSAGNASKFRFSVSSRRNVTGHRLVGVKIFEDIYSVMEDAGIELTVDVEQAHFRCNTSESIRTTALTEATPVTFRRLDYELFNGLGYYKMHTMAQNWVQAMLTCIKEGAHLLVVNSEEEAGLAKVFYDRKPRIQGATWTSKHVFIGLGDHAIEGQYVTVLGQPQNSSGYIKWGAGHPLNDPSCADHDRNCAVMVTDGTFHMVGCSCKAPFICEQEL